MGSSSKQTRATKESLSRAPTRSLPGLHARAQGRWSNGPPRIGARNDQVAQLTSLVAKLQADLAKGTGHGSGTDEGCDEVTGDDAPTIEGLLGMANSTAFAMGKLHPQTLAAFANVEAAREARRQAKPVSSQLRDVDRLLAKSRKTLDNADKEVAAAEEAIAKAKSRLQDAEDARVAARKSNDELEAQRTILCSSTAAKAEGPASTAPSDEVLERVRTQLAGFPELAQIMACFRTQAEAKQALVPSHQAAGSSGDAPTNDGAVDMDLDEGAIDAGELDWMVRGLMGEIPGEDAAQKEVRVVASREKVKTLAKQQEGWSFVRGRGVKSAKFAKKE